MGEKRGEVIYVVEELEHVGYDRVFAHSPRAFSSIDAAEEYARERCLSYSEECLMAYESMEGTWTTRLRQRSRSRPSSWTASSRRAASTTFP